MGGYTVLGPSQGGCSETLLENDSAGCWESHKGMEMA